MLEAVFKYFPSISDVQKRQLIALYAVYEDWNQKINVLSRKDFENFYIHHVLHSLAIFKYIEFKKGSKIMDLGSGGGFPSVPLAVMMPEVSFLAVDSIKKKLTVIDEVIHQLDLKNLRTNWGRAEMVNDEFDFVVSRAVAPLKDLIYWSKRKIHPISFNRLNNGLITLKGGDLKEEIKDANRKTVLMPISNYFQEEYFDTKFITYTKL